MIIFNKEKTQELNREELDYTLGRLSTERLFIAHHDEIKPVEERGHYITVKQNPDGSRDYEWIVDVEAVDAKPAYDEYETIQVYIPYTKEERKDNLRAQREAECFSIINRGQLWYDMLTETQKTDLKNWYTSWLNVTETLEIPNKPVWLK